MHAGAACTVAKHEGAPLANRKRHLIGIVAEGQRNLRRPQEQLVVDAIAQLVLRI
jgi:hypothetical protein